MAQQIINVGAVANDGTGDTIRDGGGKVNANFTELYGGHNDAEIAALRGLVSAADKIPYFTGAGTAGLLDRDVDGTMAANSDTKIATQKAIVTFVAARIAALVNSAPGALDTLKELADAIADDASFAATMTTALAGKLSLTGGTLTGALNVPDDAYDATAWNGSDAVPTKNAVRDKIEAIIAGIPGTYTDEMARDAIGAALVAGTGITITVNDPADTITIDSSGSYTDEMARDAIGVALVAGSGINIVVDDPGNQITVSATGGGAGAMTIGKTIALARGQFSL